MEARAVGGVMNLLTAQPPLSFSQVFSVIGVSKKLAITVAVPETRTFIIIFVKTT